MPPSPLIKPLRQVEILQELSPLQITEIARLADRVVFKPGDTIIAPDLPADAAVVIVSGEAERAGGPFKDADGGPIGEGALLGEMAMLVETHYTSTIVARTQVRALRLTRQQIARQMADDPALAEHFIARLSDRLKALAREMHAIADVLKDRDTAATTPPVAPALALGPAQLGAAASASRELVALG